MSKTGEQFLHERDANFQKSRQVEDVISYLSQSGEKIPNSPDAKIAAYLGFLASKDYVNDGILTGSEQSIRRQIETHVIKAEDVSESYFTLQQRIAREQGHGDVDITPEIRYQLVEAVQADQRAGLEKWVEYLGGDDGGYPNWFRHYVWESVVKLGNFDKEAREFSRRSTGTTAPYPELNQEALAYVYDNLVRNRLAGETPNDEVLSKLLKSANFGKLYAHAVLEVTPDDPELRNSVEGNWRKYDQTDDPRTARRLSGSLQGHGTGWCTAGESTAATQLELGDFYVYYTKDQDGKDTIPRVAIRMEQGEVVEVRGINAEQNLEDVMADIAMDKLANLPGGKEYQKKADDMKRLTEIDNKISANPDIELTFQEISFLYELNSDIEGFGYGRDPRIDEIKALRGERDLPEISKVLPEILANQTKNAHEGYSQVAELIGGEQISEEEFTELIESQFADWEKRGVLDYLVQDLIENGNKPNLIATPNVLVDWKTLKNAAINFGEDQPLETYIYEELWSQYTPEQLSGKPTDGPLRFSILPSGFTERLGYKNVPDQLNILEQMKTKQPELNFHVPRPLQAVTNWFTLQTKGSVKSSDRTYVRHFDLPEKVLDGGAYVPSSFVGDGGGPGLGRRWAGDGYGGRLAVG